jgi:hypothetical protein
MSPIKAKLRGRRFQEHEPTLDRFLFPLLKIEIPHTLLESHNRLAYALRNVFDPMEKEEEVLKKDAPLEGRSDSFVVETNVHYPTDINLLLDAMRKVIFLIGDLCEKEGLSDWRQYQYNYKSLNKLMRKAQNKKRGHARSEESKEKKEQEIKEAHQNYISAAQCFLEKAKATLSKIF